MSISGRWRMLSVVSCVLFRGCEPPATSLGRSQCSQFPAYDADLGAKAKTPNYLPSPIGLQGSACATRGESSASALREGIRRHEGTGCDLSHWRKFAGSINVVSWRNGRSKTGRFSGQPFRVSQRTVGHERIPASVHHRRQYPCAQHPTRILLPGSSPSRCEGRGGVLWPFQTMPTVFVPPRRLDSQRVLLPARSHTRGPFHSTQRRR